eukprot:ANDGO_04910.mRNA.1 Protein shq1
MITPYFELTQDENFVIIRIRVPHVRSAEMEFYIMQREFKFFVHPYLLALHFDQELIEDGSESATYNFDTGFSTVLLPKLNKGEHFTSLEMLTSLLTNKSRPLSSSPSLLLASSDASSSVVTKKPLIEVVSEETFGDEQRDIEVDISDQMHASHFAKSATVELSGVQRYGFACLHSQVFSDLHEDISEILSNPDPEKLSQEDISLQKRIEEESAFDADQYLFDTFGNEDDIKPIMRWDPKYSDLVVFSTKENEFMLKLPKKEFLPFSRAEQHDLCMDLVDILLAYAYDHRINMGDPSVESDWCIAKCSGVLSWLVRFENVEAVLTSFFRRSLSFPLYRNFKLATRVQSDVVAMLKNGQKAVLRALLECKYLFDRAEARFRLSTIYLTDYCVWVQTLSDTDSWSALANELESCKIEKSSLDLSLLEYEAIALEDMQPDSRPPAS